MAYKTITDPLNEFKALALAYIQAQNLSSRAPEEILDMYSDALDRIYKHYEENR